MPQLIVATSFSGTWMPISFHQTFDWIISNHSFVFWLPIDLDFTASTRNFFTFSDFALPCAIVNRTIERQRKRMIFHTMSLKLSRYSKSVTHASNIFSLFCFSFLFLLLVAELKQSKFSETAISSFVCGGGTEQAPKKENEIMSSGLKESWILSTFLFLPLSLRWTARTWSFSLIVLVVSGGSFGSFIRKVLVACFFCWTSEWRHALP